MGEFGAAGDAARLDHVAKQAEIGEVETHGQPLGDPSRFAKADYLKNAH